MENKETYNGREVHVSGYIGYGFEQCILWPEDPAEHQVPVDKWIWYWNEDCMTNTQDPGYGYAIITGIFDMTDQGHLGSYGAAISNAQVTRKN